MKKLLIATAGASALLVSACGEDAEIVETEETFVEPAIEPVGTTWDTNADGIFQEAEYNAWGDQGITAWDTNGDGLLSEQEFTEGWTVAGFTSPDIVYTAWDDDGDGFLNNDEFFDDEDWTEWDTDASGTLEDTEFNYY